MALRHALIEKLVSCHESFDRLFGHGLTATGELLGGVE